MMFSVFGHFAMPQKRWIAIISRTCFDVRSFYGGIKKEFEMN
jgi:hypothetical protein